MHKLTASSCFDVNYLGLFPPSTDKHSESAPPACMNKKLLHEGSTKQHSSLGFLREDLSKKKSQINCQLGQSRAETSSDPPVETST